MEILKEKVLLPQEVKSFLEKLSKKSQLSYIEERTLHYLKKTQKLNEKSAKELLDKLSNKFEEILPKQTIIKIVEFLPKDKDELKVVLYGIDLDSKYIEEILAIVKDYLEE